MSAKRYASIRQQIARLEREAEKLRKSAIQGVVQQIRSMMEEHGISVGDLGKARRGRPPKSAGAAVRGRKAAGKRGAAAKAAKPAKAAKAAKGTKTAKAAKPAKAGKAKRTAKVKPKYRSPEDRKLTWSGRGRAPAWVKNWTQSGKSIEDLLIK